MSQPHKPQATPTHQTEKSGEACPGCKELEKKLVAQEQKTLRQIRKIILLESLFTPVIVALRDALESIIDETKVEYSSAKNRAFDLVPSIHMHIASKALAAADAFLEGKPAGQEARPLRWMVAGETTFERMVRAYATLCTDAGTNPLEEIRQRLTAALEVQREVKTLREVREEFTHFWVLMQGQHWEILQFDKETDGKERFQCRAGYFEAGDKLLDLPAIGISIPPIPTEG